MNRRTFLTLSAAALMAPEELVLGRSQVSVPGLWRPPLTYDANDMIEAIQLEYEMDTEEALSRILFGTGRHPNTLQFHPAALQTILDLSSSFDAHPARDDAFLGYDRTKLYG